MDYLYFIIDKIYSNLVFFVKSLYVSINEKEAFFSMIQEKECKPVECCFPT